MIKLSEINSSNPLKRFIVYNNVVHEWETNISHLDYIESNLNSLKNIITSAKNLYGSMLSDVTAYILRNSSVVRGTIMNNIMTIDCYEKSICSRATIKVIVELAKRKCCKTIKMFDYRGKSIRTVIIECTCDFNIILNKLEESLI